MDSSTSFSRYRSPTFSDEEVKTLLNLAEKYKYVLLNKSNNFAANTAKEVAWVKIAENFNTQGLKHARNADNLRTKWGNLKKEAIKLTSGVFDKYIETNEFAAHVAEMMLDVENNSNASKELQSSQDELLNGGEDTANMRFRSPTFSGEEVKALLDLVYSYKSILLCKSTTSAVNRAKDAVWANLTKKFNCQKIGIERNQDCLRTKWENLKRGRRRHNENVNDANNEDYDINNKVLTIISEADNVTGTLDFDTELNGVKNNANVRFSRSPHFSGEEVKALLDLVDSYKSIILCKSTTSALNRTKDAVWANIAKKFNRQRIGIERNQDCLKTKWENLKRGTKRHIDNGTDANNEDYDINNKVLIIMSEADNATSTLDFDTELNEMKDEIEPANVTEKETDDSDVADEDVTKHRRDSNFTAKECNLLLKCVREEKKYVCSTDTTSKANRLKHRAWERVTESFNRLSPRQRSMRVLRTKFVNMKNLSNRVNFFFEDKNNSRNNKYKGLKSNENIKPEPLFEDESNFDAEQDNCVNNDDYNELNLQPDGNAQFVPDPLSTVLNSDSGTGSLMDVYQPSENKEVAKLKLELLNCQLENAKLERQRLEAAIKAESADNEWKAIERSIRLRKARLETIAAEMKLPPMHPALQYTAEEAKAQQYFAQYM